MKVVDANVIVELVANGLDPSVLGDEPLAAPHLLDSEVLQALRSLELGGELTRDEAETALATFTAIAIERHPVAPLRARIWQLRHNLTAYDAAYVALAEALHATSLLTMDSGIAQAPGVHCVVQAL